VRVRGNEARPRGDGTGSHRVLQTASGPLQGAAGRDLRRAAQDLHWKDPKIHVAREGEIRQGDRQMSAVPQTEPAVLLREDRDGICTLTMNRPARMNLLTREMLNALQDAFD